MTRESLHQIFLSLSVASFAHVGLYAAVTDTDGSPNVLIEGQSISVHLATPGNAAQDSAASAHREEKVAGQSASETTEQTEAPKPQPVATPKPAQRPEPPRDSIPQANHTPKKQTAAPEERQAVEPVHLPETPHAIAHPQKVRPEPPVPAKQQTLPAKEEAPAPSAPPQHAPETAKPHDQSPPKAFAESPPEQADMPPATQTNKAADLAHKRGDGTDAEDADASAASAASVAGSASAADGKQSATPGNAAASNYAGLVMRHLSRFRRPRASGPGSAFVTFTLSGDGGITGIEVSRSSGSRKFDREALRFTERAAPFPAPPQEAGRTFTVKIEGR